MMICFLLLPTSLYAAPVQWTVADGGNGHWYEAVSVPSRISWSNANANAIGSEGYLATVTSGVENAFVTSLISANPAFWWSVQMLPPDPPGVCWVGPWLGGHQDSSAPDYSEPAGGWRWVTGEPWGYSNWAVLEPNNGWDTTSQIEDRLCYTIKGSDDLSLGTWNDCQDAPLCNGYIVEWNSNPVPEPSSILALFLGLGGIGGMVWRRKR